MISKIPGGVAAHAIITPECITIRGRQGAITEAIRRIQEELISCIEGWYGQNAGHRVNFHVVLTYERLQVTTEPPSPGKYGD